ncbi:MAG: hypothetical protein SGILL_009919 [Bacillariaceae sp.]
MSADIPTTLLQTGIQSFWDLSNAFLTTLLGKDDDAQQPSLIICGASDASTYFYLEHPFHNPPGSCFGTDWVVILILTVIIHTISWGTRWLLWEPLAKYRMQGIKSFTLEEQKRFSMTCTACMNFTLSAVFAYRILGNKPWLLERQDWTVRQPLIDADFKFYYLLYAARFLSDMVSLLFESRQLDALIAAVIHHCVTLGLIFGSAMVGHTRYGGVIMFFFDWADIPLLLAKACKYVSKSNTDLCQLAANRLFEFFAVLFFATRCVLYNYVVYAAWMDLTNDWVNRVCQYLLLLLVALQTYWMGLIINAAVRISNNGGVAEDARDDDLKKDKKKTQ